MLTRCRYHMTIAGWLNRVSYVVQSITTKCITLRRVIFLAIPLIHGLYFLSAKYTTTNGISGWASTAVKHADIVRD